MRRKREFVSAFFSVEFCERRDFKVPWREGFDNSICKLKLCFSASLSKSRLKMCFHLPFEIKSLPMFRQMKICKKLSSP